MSYIRIMVHLVWGTYRDTPLLIKEKRDVLFNHIRKNAREKDVYLDAIGGYTDHVHCLLSLGGEQSIAKVVQLIINPKLMWAADYFAASVSDSAVRRVREYIHNQEEHHRKVSFSSEYKNLLRRMDFNFLKPEVNSMRVIFSAPM
jgi:putative transposase